MKQFGIRHVQCVDVTVTHLHTSALGNVAVFIYSHWLCFTSLWTLSLSNRYCEPGHDNTHTYALYKRRQQMLSVFKRAALWEVHWVCLGVWVDQYLLSASAVSGWPMWKWLSVTKICWHINVCKYDYINTKPKSIPQDWRNTPLFVKLVTLCNYAMTL